MRDYPTRCSHCEREIPPGDILYQDTDSVVRVSRGKTDSDKDFSEKSPQHALAVSKEAHRLLPDILAAYPEDTTEKQIDRAFELADKFCRRVAADADKANAEVEKKKLEYIGDDHSGRPGNGKFGPSTAYHKPGVCGLAVGVSACILNASHLGGNAVCTPFRRLWPCRKCRNVGVYCQCVDGYHLGCTCH